MLARVLIFVALAFCAGFAGAEERYGPQKVVYHINKLGGEENKAYGAALTNIRNHVAAVGADNIDVKVVLHGDGVELLRQAVTDTALQMSVTDLKSQNVQFLVCNNTLEGREIDPDADLFEVFEEDIVPSGVAELSHLQQQGYTYVKP